MEQIWQLIYVLNDFLLVQLKILFLFAFELILKEIPLCNQLIGSPWLHGSMQYLPNLYSYRWLISTTCSHVVDLR